MLASSSLLLVSLATVAIAYPGMGAVRRDPGLLGVVVSKVAQVASGASATASVSVSISSSASSSYPAWHPPRVGEVRSPCPGLNTLANHDICPRSGKGYTLPILTDCLAKGLNVGPDFALIVGTAGIACNPDPLLLSFDLDMLDRHDALIEHDASLSRADAFTGDDHTFNQTIWNTVLAYYNNSVTATIPLAANARYNRILVEKRRDPQFTFGVTQLLFQTAETALYLSTMGSPVTGKAPVSFIRSFFEQEKLPYELGWQPPTVPTTIASLTAMLVQILAATGETLPDGLVLGEHSLKAAFLGLNAVTGEVENAAVYTVAQLTGALGVLAGSS